MHRMPQLLQIYAYRRTGTIDDDGLPEIEDVPTPIGDPSYDVEALEAEVRRLQLLDDKHTYSLEAPHEPTRH